MRSALRSPLAWALAGVLLSGPALAADTTTFNVTLVVTKACTITAAAATNVANSVIVNLPALQVRPSADDLQALATETAQVLLRP